ncbi:MAG: hypothetical protein BGP06_11220 [Rhizobiales bacterium 65-9]|nr:hypothetical protein [Hyphomicrobiales bacterium]OJY32891.1 MAG: hypothetical protein BGP06_11220 [Rhizobiales bacterium 65-9]
MKPWMIAAALVAIVAPQAAQARGGRGFSAPRAPAPAPKPAVAAKDVAQPKTPGAKADGRPTFVFVSAGAAGEKEQKQPTPDWLAKRPAEQQRPLEPDGVATRKAGSLSAPAPVLGQAVAPAPRPSFQVLH